MREARDFVPNMDECVCVLSLYRHFKGDLYEILAFATSASDKSTQVIYRKVGVSGQYPWVRPLAEFYQDVKNDDGVWVRRFVAERQRILR